MTPPGFVKPEEQQYLVDYLNSGGALYIEGSDVGDDLQGTNLFAMFAADFLAGGGQNEISTLSGQPGTITENLSYTYNSNDTDCHYSVDHLAANGGEVLFQSNEGYEPVIASDFRGYRTIVSSVILGCYTNSTGNNTREYLMDQYLSHLDVDYSAEGEVCGMIIDDFSLDPIENVHITIGSAEGYTDANGFYSILVEDGVYSMLFEHDDYNTATAQNIVIIPIETTTYNCSLTPLVSNNNELPLITELQGNYPNPFNPSTTISFSISENSIRTELIVYNIRGQKVKALINDNLSAGKHEIEWNGKDDFGKSVASGIYFYKMKAGKYKFTKKMILME